MSKTEQLFKTRAIGGKTISETLRYSVKTILGTVEQLKPSNNQTTHRLKDTPAFPVQKIRPSKFPLKNEDMKSTRPLIGLTVDKDEPKEVYLNPNAHTLFTGITQGSGKTTALEGVLSRWEGKKIIVCVCKQGEQTFRHYRTIKPFMKTKNDWRYLQSIIDTEMNEKNRAIRAELISVCTNASSLENIYANTKDALDNKKYNNEHEKKSYFLLKAYLEQVINNIAKYRDHFVDVLDPADGINVMHLENYGPELQSVVVGSVAQEILESGWKDIILAVTEAWEILPGRRGSPANLQLEAFIRKGASNKNFLFMDSQDLSIHTPIRRQISNLLVGKQSEPGQIGRMLNHFPTDARVGSDDIRQLQLGQFFYISGQKPEKIFCIPSWLNFGDALNCAMLPEYVYEVLRRTKER